MSPATPRLSIIESFILLPFYPASDAPGQVSMLRLWAVVVPLATCAARLHSRPCNTIHLHPIQIVPHAIQLVPNAIQLVPNEGIPSSILFVDTFGIEIQDNRCVALSVLIPFPFFNILLSYLKRAKQLKAKVLVL